MICEHCGTAGPDDALSCGQCGKPVADPTATSIDPVEDTSSMPTQISGAQGFAAVSQQMKVLPEGLEIGKRYRVEGLLGQGGMGSVYRVYDNELDRAVALKVIRPEIANSPVVLERFKREIQLSSQVTHRNVLRVYDLGESDGIKFVTMQLVEGEELADIIRREGALPVERITKLFRQICKGLAAAHEQDVVHRDLKPQNILVDKEGQLFLTDFGLAKSLDQSAMTRAGEILGTPYYMSPEQVKGEPVDRRSDIYALGVILYELATGKVPFTGNSMYEVMIQRVQSTAKPISSLNPGIPAYLRSIAERCMATEPAARYASVEEILSDLESGSFKPTLRYMAGRQRWLKPVAALVVLAALLGFGGRWLYLRGRTVEPVAQTPRSVLIADFDNRTGDFIFDGTLEPEFRIALEGASFLHAYRRGQARRVAAQLRPGAKVLDEELARLVAVREGIDFVASGSIGREDGEYRLEVRCVDPANGEVVTVADAEVEDKERVLGAVAELAARVRRALGDSTSVAAQLAEAETFSAASLEAAHEYGLAQELQFAGEYDDAIRHYARALEFDPDLGRANAGLGVIYSNTGQRVEAEEQYSTALARIDRMSDREKFRTRGGYFLIVRRDPDKAIQEYRQLVDRYPADAAGLGNLALSYFYKRDMGRALQEGRKALELYPNNVPQRNNVGLYAMYAGDFEAAIDEQLRVLELNPDFPLARVGLALSQLASGQPEPAGATYEELRDGGGWGGSVAMLGLADIALYEGRLDDAVALLEQGIDEDLATESAHAAAAKLVALAGAKLQRGATAAAVSALERAMSLSSGADILYPAARSYLEAGDEAAATEIATRLKAALEPDPRSYANLIEGEILLRKGKLPEAIYSFELAREQADSWIARYLLGLAYLEAEAYLEADAELEACVRRRGEATALFLNEMPSYRFFPPVHYYLGLALEGLRSPAADDAFRDFLALRENGDEDPLVADARRRLTE